MSVEMLWVAVTSAALTAWVAMCRRINRQRSEHLRTRLLALRGSTALEQSLARFDFLMEEYARDAARWTAGTSAGTDTKVS